MTAVNALIDWAAAHQPMLSGLAVLSMITFIGTLVAIPVLVIHIPEDHFLPENRSPISARINHFGLRLLFLVLKNVLGVLFVLAGIAMLVLPGQGLLTILIGIMLMSFPGKYTLQRRIVMQAHIFKAINRMRARAGRPPIRVGRSKGREWRHYVF